MDFIYEAGSTTLDPGDWLVVFTDGIVEAHNADDEEFGLERLETLVGSIRSRSAEEIGKEVLARVTEWGPGEQDDRTVVILHPDHAPNTPPCWDRRLRGGA